MCTHALVTAGKSIALWNRIAEPFIVLLLAAVVFQKVKGTLSFIPQSPKSPIWWPFQKNSLLESKTHDKNSERIAGDFWGLKAPYIEMSIS